MPTECKIELLGGLRLTVGDETITRFRTRKTGELLAYLAYFRRRPHPREVLIELLWPECDMDTGRHNLSMALSALRQQCSLPDKEGADGVLLQTDRHAISLNADAITIDVAEFEAAFRAAECAEATSERVAALAKAVELYAGELLPGYYEDWIFPEQQRMAELFFRALRQLIGLLEAAGEVEKAIPHALHAIRMDKLREDSHRELIRLYIAANQPESALRHYRELERLLHQELDAAPDTETRALILSMPSRQKPTAAPTPKPVPAAQTPPNSAAMPVVPLESVGGAVPLGSQFYIVRPTDAEFQEAVARRDSIVLVKGPRQVGKTSLLARGLQQARKSEAKVILSHFQIFNAGQLESADTLLLALAENIVEQLNLDVIPAEKWDARRGANQNFRRFLMRDVLNSLETPLVWGLDEVDRLFGCAFGSEIFALFRSWHDERALDPDSLWNRLTLAIAYATEAHLFITDLNQSPFNVGTRLTLEDFTPEEVSELNERYGGPLHSEDNLARFYRLVNGQPYLTRRGLDELARRRFTLDALEAQGDRDEGPFGDHLRRIVSLLLKDPALCDVVRGVLQGQPCPTRESFHRLHSAGVLTSDSQQEARPRCQLYASYLSQRLL